MSVERHAVRRMVIRFSCDRYPNRCDRRDTVYYDEGDEPRVKHWRPVYLTLGSDPLWFCSADHASEHLDWVAKSAFRDAYPERVSREIDVDLTLGRPELKPVEPAA